MLLQLYHRHWSACAEAILSDAQKELCALSPDTAVPIFYLTQRHDLLSPKLHSLMLQVNQSQPQNAATPMLSMPCTHAKSEHAKLIPHVAINAGCTALRKGALPSAMHHYTCANMYGWLPLTAAYLTANQLQPALALLQHAIAHSYSPHASQHSTLAAAAATQLAAEWSTLVLNMMKDEAAPGGLTQLLFPSPQGKQLGACQVSFTWQVQHAILQYYQWMLSVSG